MEIEEFKEETNNQLSVLSSLVKMIINDGEMTIELGCNLIRIVDICIRRYGDDCNDLGIDQEYSVVQSYINICDMILRRLTK